MEYIVVIEPSTNEASFLTDSHGFLELFAEYDDAKQAANDFKQFDRCSDAVVYARCTDERNHLI